MVVSFCAKAQNSQYRFDYFDARKLNQNWGTENSLGLVYFKNTLNPGSRVQLRNTFNYRIDPKQQLLGGLWFYYYDSKELPTTVEVRPWLGYDLVLNKNGSVFFSNRIRYEHRMNFYLNSVADHSTNHVLRFRTLANFALWKAKESDQKLTALVGPEFFLGSVHLVRDLEYNRFRALLGLNYVINKKLSTSITVVPEYIQSNKINLHDFNTLIIFMGLKRTL